jgi:Ferritin-like domain
LNQEWIELDLFHHGLALFSAADFDAAGINAQDRFLIEFMADQEVGHAIMVSDMLGRMCYYCPCCSPAYCDISHRCKTV